ncbi:acyl-CoA dehydrogenase/oxidase C-terminal [Gautieria morchelliformis]|nr:acyl-CoA dehydrogenase/oxidase C-terminal [Gautieria morchelliformis]
MSQVEDMRVARAQTTIDIDDVKHFLRISDGKEEWDRHSRMVQIISEDPVFDKSRRLHMARKELYFRGLAITKRLLDFQEKYHWSDQDVDAALAIIDEGIPLYLHHMAFLPVILSQGSTEQVKTYGGLGRAHAILGAYAQTELAHGTQVSKLETTATYIPETREFELHTPRLESTKWWIGALAKFATHCVVQARLILPEGDKGVHLFLLQIRSLESHKILPGITLGDIGPKAFGGMPATDNGFMRLTHVRVPLSAMLSKFASVTEQGQYKVPVHSKLGYGGMVYIRASMISHGGWLTAKAVTIAIRYGIVRRQGNGPPGQETQVITYPSLRHRLLPILSRAYAWIFVGRGMITLYSEMLSQLAEESTSLLAETHAVSSGLKVLVASSTSADLETARRSMGGHGYSAMAGIGRLWANWVPANTYEGDNYVLVQQVIRAAVKSLQAVVSSSDPVEAARSLPQSTYFLRLLPDLTATHVAAAPLTWSAADAIYLLELRAAHMVQDYASHLEPQSSDGSADWRVARAVTEAFVALRIGKVIVEVEKKLRTPSAATVVALMRLYLLSTLETALVDLLSFDLIPRRTPNSTETTLSGRDPTRSLRSAIANLEQEILPEVIGLTDAFGFTDWELDSALGVKDGRAYEALWERAQLEPLNETEIPAGYEEYIKPILERGRVLVQRGKAKL